MSLKCFFGHQWNGCKCKRCGATRDEGHMWNGCKCEQCGKSRNEEHMWTLLEGKCIEKCSICGKERSTEHKWSGGKCKRCGANWTPTNPRLASNMPLSSLLRVFIFTNGDGRTVLKCPVAMGTLSDTAGTVPDEIAGKVPVDIIAKSNVATQCEQTGQFPFDAWVAMTNINADITGKAQMGEYKTVIRPVTNPNTGESSCCVLIYKKQELTFDTVKYGMP